MTKPDDKFTSRYHRREGISMWYTESFLPTVSKSMSPQVPTPHSSAMSCDCP